MKLFRTTDGTALNYRSMGHGKPIIMIHTIHMNHTVFEDVAKRLSRHYQVILIDLRGHGYSDKPLRIDFEDYAQDISELMDFLYLKSSLIIANELGSSIAMDLAVRFPDKVTELVLINPTASNDMLPKERLFLKYAEKVRTWDKADQEQFFEKHLYYAKSKVRKFLKGVDNSAELLTDYEQRAVDSSFQNKDIKDLLMQVNKRTLVIAGDANERVTPIESKDVADLIKDSEFLIFKKSGVYPFVEEKERFLKTLKTFTEKSAKTASV
ncbi:alpha/beta fold hydrolase [Staphylococcus ratti]|uniref:Alpha/beta hydrolase n=1 Tax=Staphylococcus ratti TaxID=2892440 RepID=A0ABY3PC30_9STAP|nr:alpha/beta hydrolase [Staphylococcus ratti]UEX89861.1 alpha/beta hydrolase [Staphylococcus ratti]